MVLSLTRIVGGGNFNYVLDDGTKVVTWTRPMRPGTTARTRLVNVTQQLGLAIVSFTTNAAGHILTTTYTGDASTWLATDGLAMMIDDNVPGGLFTTTVLVTVGILDDTEVIWTDKVTRNQRFERIGLSSAFSTGGKSGVEFGCDAVGLEHMIIHTAINPVGLFQIANVDNWAVRDLVFNYGRNRAIDWSNADAGDEGIIDRCKFIGLANNLGCIRLRSTGSAKKITINNTKFYFQAADGNTTASVFNLEGALSHTILVNYSTFWRVGNIFRTGNAGNVMTVKNSIVFAQRSVSGSGAVPTYTDCIGDSAIAAGITSKTEQECFLAYHKSPKSLTVFPFDPSYISDAASATKDAGSPVSGVLEDSRGVVRDLVNPDIGPEEDFDGFGVVVTVPSAPVIVT